MPNGKYELDDNTFMALSVKQQNLIMFRTVNKYREENDKKVAIIENRIRNLNRTINRQKGLNVLLAGFGGIIGGILSPFKVIK